MNDTKIIILVCVGVTAVIAAIILLSDHLAKTLRFNWLLAGFAAGALVAMVFGMAAQRASHNSVHKIRESHGID